MEEINTIRSLFNEFEDAKNNKIEELERKVDELSVDRIELLRDAEEARCSFTGLQLAVSVLIFVYGMMYGTYVCK